MIWRGKLPLFLGWHPYVWWVLSHHICVPDFLLKKSYPQSRFSMLFLEWSDERSFLDNLKFMYFFAMNMCVGKSRLCIFDTYVYIYIYTLTSGSLFPLAFFWGGMKITILTLHVCDLLMLRIWRVGVFLPCFGHLLPQYTPFIGRWNNPFTNHWSDQFRDPGHPSFSAVCFGRQVAWL